MLKLFPKWNALAHREINSSALSFLHEPGFLLYFIFVLLVVWRVGGFSGFLFKPVSLSRLHNRNIKSAELKLTGYLRNLRFHWQLETTNKRNPLFSQSLVLHEDFRDDGGVWWAKSVQPTEKLIKKPTKTSRKGALSANHKLHERTMK